MHLLKEFTVNDFQLKFMKILEEWIVTGQELIQARLMSEAIIRKMLLIFSSVVTPNKKFFASCTSNKESNM